MGRKLVGAGSGASLEDEGAEEAIPSKEPQRSEFAFPSIFLRGRVGSEEFTRGERTAVLPEPRQQRDSNRERPAAYKVRQKRRRNTNRAAEFNAS